MTPNDIVTIRRLHRAGQIRNTVAVPASFDDPGVIALPQRKIYESLISTLATPILTARSIFGGLYSPNKFSFDPDLVSLGERFSKRSAFNFFAEKCLSLKADSALVQGCGRGYGLPEFLLRLGVKNVHACDPIDLKHVWDMVNDAYYYKYSKYISFKQSNAENLLYDDNSTDIIFSEAVYEHIDSLDLAVSESYRVLRPGGYLCHGIGPLYFTFGGDHCSGEIDALDGYSHLLLSDDEYRSIVDNDLLFKNANDPICNFWAKHSIFSFATVAEYLEKFSVKFKRIFVLAVVSNSALAFRRRCPDIWLNLNNNSFSDEDLLIKSIYICFKKI
jgi:SAM-dependent methyltransferase